MSRGFFSTFGAGTADKITTGINAVQDKRSYSIWINRNGLGGGSAGHVFTKPNTGTGQSENLYYTNTFSAYVYNRTNAAGVLTSSYRMILSGVSGLASVWLHLLLTHDQSSGTATTPVAFYNGTIFNSSSFANQNNSAPNNSPFILGQSTAANFGWDGLLAHFAVWDGIILNQGAARALHSGVHPMTIAPEYLVGYLPLDGIHSPEVDFCPGNDAATLTGTRFGVLQPAAAPMYISSRDEMKQEVFLSTAAAAAAARQYAVTVA
jgi:hypothetical protein